MGAAKSKQGEGSSSRERDEEEERKKNESSSSAKFLVWFVCWYFFALHGVVVGAAVETALLGVAWGIQRYNSRSHDSDNHVTVNERLGYDDSLESAGSPPARGYLLITESAGSPPARGSLLITDSFKNLRVTDAGFYPAPKTTLKILSYNVWANDYYKMQRMKAIARLVEDYSPDFICFQEFTPDIYSVFSESSWWEDYHCSMSPEEASKRQYFCILLSKSRPVKTIKEPLGIITKVGRELCGTETRVGSNNRSLVVATSHLKSPRPDPNDPKSEDHQFTTQRLLQAEQAVKLLKKYPNVIFGGDMNWNEEQDGEFPLPKGKGWVDAWTKLKGKKGYTYDTEKNEMLNGHSRLRMRLDRMLCNLNDFRLEDIEIIGKEVILETNKKQPPVLPSDHFGLLLTISTE